MYIALGIIFPFFFSEAHVIPTLLSPDEFKITYSTAPPDPRKTVSARKREGKAGTSASKKEYSVASYKTMNA